MRKAICITVAPHPQDRDCTKEMCNSLVGMILWAQEDNNCFIVARHDFLDAIGKQRTAGVLRHWKDAFGRGASPIYLSKNNCSEVKKVKVVAALPGEDPPGIREAWIGVEIEVAASAFDPFLGCFCLSRTYALMALALHSPHACSHYMGSSTEVVGTMLLPASICEAIS